MVFGLNKNGSMKRFLKNKFPTIFYIKNFINVLINQYVKPRKKKYWGYRSDNAFIRMPIVCSNPRNVFFEDGSHLSPNALILNYTGRFILGKNSAVSFGLTVITGNHKPVVGVPVTVSNPLHINDEERDIIVEEDVWIGVNVTLIAGAHVGRGAIIGACALVNKEIPPYAVVVGVPAKIIGVKFSKEQIIQHEMKLYPEEKRLKESELENLFATVFYNKKSVGTDFLSDSDLKKVSNYKIPDYL